jgi:hypothetical protein
VDVDIGFQLLVGLAIDMVPLTPAAIVNEDSRKITTRRSKNPALPKF